MRRRLPSTRLLDRAPLRLRYEYLVVLKVCSPSGGVLSRFLPENDKRFAEGCQRAEEVLQALRLAGLKTKVKKHLAKGGEKLLMVFDAVVEEF